MSAPPPPSAAGPEPRLSPAVRKLVGESGIDPSAILGIGKMEKRAVVRLVGGADAILVRPMCYVSLTIDHRVIGGAQANAWLARFVEVLEKWPAP
jgi:pyruvate/2-oxoglutarate dehydrogenase complex dihydrolipoamide acyltransferase (E2) component